MPTVPSCPLLCSPRSLASLSFQASFLLVVLLSLTTSLRPDREGKRYLSHSGPLGRRCFAICSLLLDIKGQSLRKTCLIFSIWIHLTLLPQWDKLWRSQGTSFSPQPLRAAPTSVRGTKGNYLLNSTAFPQFLESVGQGGGRSAGAQIGVDAVPVSVLL